MSKTKNLKLYSIFTLSSVALAACLGLTASAFAQTAKAPSASEDDVIVVTGFRASLNKALNEKRNETASIDSIVAEDIGKFPDANLAESMQRIPGVALSRGDGGEGRNITVRGLGAQFTRVRINGMEGTSQTGSSDIFGAGNSGRSFDFNAFSSEIFSALTVRKTPSADVEEGSLGATVDLIAPKPLDQKEDFVFTATARAVYNENAEKLDPRMSALVSKQFADGRFGVLGSLAYSKRHLREVGYSAVDILSANTNGGFCSPIGYATVNPALNATKGTTATDCSTGNPRTSDLNSYLEVFNARRPDLPATPGSGAFLPRIPRYTDSVQDQERIGATLSLQAQPDDRTEVSFDLLYSRFNVVRDDNYIEAISFGRSASNNGQPMTSIRDIELDANGSLIYGLFDGVDIRSEGLHAEFISTFQQANLSFKREIFGNFSASGMIGVNQSKWEDKRGFRYFIDALDVDGYSIDFRGGDTTPVIKYGFDVSNPANFQYGPGLADGTVIGGIDLRSKPYTVTTDGMTGELDFSWVTSDSFTVKFGGQFRRAEQQITDARVYNADLAVVALPSGTSLASITRQITGVDKLWGRGAPASWTVLDWSKAMDVFNLNNARRCYAECGSSLPRVLEDKTSAYLMGTFDFSPAGVGVRGDFGVRYINTKQESSGYVSVSSSSSPTGVTGRLGKVEREYEDYLPSVNIVVEPLVDNLLFRFSAAKVMSRPELGSLTPTSGVNPITRTGNVNNPFLDPIRAKTWDAAVEWYYGPGALLSFAFFHKDVETYIQRVKSQIPFNQLGLPNELLVGSNTTPDELFTISRPFNTPGGPLSGIELNAQVPFTFLPGFWSNFGVLANVTKVTSEIQYVLASVNGVPTVTTTADLIGLSRNTASGTVYYEDDKFSIRSTATYRDKFILGIPASPGSDLQGNDSTLYVDASASYNVSDRIKLILELQNLTDEQNRLFVDSKREDTLFELNPGRNATIGVTYRF